MSQLLVGLSGVSNMSQILTQVLFAALAPGNSECLGCNLRLRVKAQTGGLNYCLVVR